MSEATEPAPGLLDLVFGYMPAQAVHVAARLGLADHLAAGATSSAELAAATQCDAAAVRRLLRAMAGLGAVTEPEPDRFALTAAGATLRSDAPDSIRSLVLLFCGDDVWRSWGQLEYSVRTGRPAWDKVTGMSPFEYFAAHPDESATFNAAMAEHTRSVAPALVEAYDFAGLGSLVDVGGGDGTLLAAVLRSAPNSRGTVFDLPDGLPRAAETLAAAGVDDRGRVVAGDFFDAVPDGADAYLLKSVLHDWDDERAAAILRNCRAAMSETAVVLVIEPVMPERIRSAGEAGPVMSDLNMLVNTGGRERTRDEFAALFAAAGLELVSTVATASEYSVIEGRPA